MNKCEAVCGPSKLDMLAIRIRDFALELAYTIGLKDRPKSSVVQHAEREFVAAGYIPISKEQEDGPNKWIQESVLELLDMFSRQGHSGFSAQYAVETFRKLALYEPLAPLSGAEDEWNEVGDGIWQNNRCSHVFKQEDGKAYDIDGRIFREWNERDLDPDEDGFPGKHRFESCYTNRDSRVYISFPYTPSREYVDVEPEMLASQ